MVQALTDTLLAAEFVVKTPAGHAVQLDAAGVPGFETIPKKPGAQIEQFATDRLPGALVKTPGGHRAQLLEDALAYEPCGHCPRACCSSKSR